MTITITQNVFGFHVAIVSDDRERFAWAIESFKLAIPKRNRRFLEAGRVWYVDKRAEPKLRRWLDSISQTGDTKVFEIARSKGFKADEAA